MDLFDRGPMGPSRMEFQKPVIAAITGYCVAGSTSPVWKIQKMVKNPCLSVKNMCIGCEKFQKKFGLIWRFP